MSTAIETVPVGVTSGKASSIGGPYTGAVISSFIAPADGGSITALDWIFLTNLDETVSGPTSKMTYSSEVLDPKGSGIVLSVPPAGGMFSVKGGVSMGVALDALKHVIVPLSFSDTNVSPML